MERPIFRLTASSTELAAADRFDVINWIRSFEWFTLFPGRGSSVGRVSAVEAAQCVVCMM